MKRNDIFKNIRNQTKTNLSSLVMDKIDKEEQESMYQLITKRCGVMIDKIDKSDILSDERKLNFYMIVQGIDSFAYEFYNAGKE
ncbi:MAG: hypothetical protein DRG78_18790 [Epsilonproteobacteria bacterium]|nr:MAG: hypothetical protein DRG78_18790 [Campylobacterota bacterium]